MTHHKLVWWLLYEVLMHLLREHVSTQHNPYFLFNDKITISGERGKHYEFYFFIFFDCLAGKIGE